MSTSNVHFAHTSPINPAGATPQLTREQVWAGLQRKVRHADEFVPVIVDCRVVSDEGNVVVRDIQFDALHGQGKTEVKGETCKSFEPTKVEFWQPDGTLICNIVSEGGEGGADAGEMYMTYTFEWPAPKKEPGSDEYKAELKRYRGMARTAVDSSLATIRKMVQEGKI